eukprot:7207355-Alexandrium_andersonii.AAC.1
MLNSKQGRLRGYCLPTLPRHLPRPGSPRRTREPNRAPDATEAHSAPPEGLTPVGTLNRPLQTYKPFKAAPGPAGGHEG